MKIAGQKEKKKKGKKGKETAEEEETTDDQPMFETKKKRLNLPEEFEKLKKYNVTEADKTGFNKTMFRAYSRRLYLVVQDEAGWRYPQTQYDAEKDETLRSTAERGIQQETNGFEAWMVGNCPMGHLKKDDALHLFFNAEIVWLEGQRLPNVNRMQLTNNIKDYAWVTREELKDLFNEELFGVSDKMLSKT